MDISGKTKSERKTRIATIRQSLKKRSLLYAELLFTALAFFLMVILSYNFTGNIVSNNLLRYAESVAVFAETKIEADLLESRISLSHFAQTLRSFILRGYETDRLQDYISNMSDRLLDSENRISEANNYFAYIAAYPEAPTIISGDRLNYPGGVEPTQWQWYRDAVEAEGNLVETKPYFSDVSGESVITYSSGMYDDEGNFLGIACLNLPVKDIGKEISSIAIDRGGYGMLFDQDLNIVTHANPEFVGLNLKDVHIPLSAFAEDLANGAEVSEMYIKDWKGDDSVAFVRQMPNGLFLGLMTLRGPFYQSVSNMMLILCLLGTTLAAALIVVLIRIDAAKNKSDMESRQKSAFLANMSHEMRTPMNAIIGMTSIGTATSDMEKIKYCFKKIENASNHLLGVINDVLDMSKIEANKLELSPVSFDFEEMLQNAVNVVNLRVDERRQNLYAKIGADMPHILFGDGQRLQQVVINLLSNAVKFTPEEGSITVEARLLSDDGSACRLQISVSDTGIGITDEQRGRLFRSFEQAEAGTTRKYGGTGLGLAISKRIVEMMDGEIWVDSAPGMGSTFTFTVLLGRGACEMKSANTEGIRFDDLRLLIADDDAEIREFFTSLSESLGINCKFAAGGEEAARLLGRGDDYNLCFFDWDLPGISGLELARGLSGAVNKPVVILLASELVLKQDDTNPEGVDKLLSKPLFRSAVVDTINECIGVNNAVEKCETDKEPEDFAGCTVLLAEDVEINREIVITLLAPTGLNIICAENGKQVVELFEADPDKYDMIFMDLQMPELDGLEATRRIRSLGFKRAEEIHITAMTANVFKEDIERCLAAGMNSHISKPINLEQILAELRACKRS